MILVLTFSWMNSIQTQIIAFRSENAPSPQRLLNVENPCLTIAMVESYEGDCIIWNTWIIQVTADS